MTNNTWKLRILYVVLHEVHTVHYETSVKKLTHKCSLAQVLFRFLLIPGRKSRFIADHAQYPSGLTRKCMPVRHVQNIKMENNGLKYCHIEDEDGEKLVSLYVH